MNKSSSLLMEVSYLYCFRSNSSIRKEKSDDDPTKVTTQVGVSLSHFKYDNPTYTK